MLIPDHETAVDFLNYEAIATTVTEILKNNRQRALTIGIHGDWGAGKSSVLKMVEASMAKDDKVACLWFNGWTFQGFDDAKTVLIESIITELSRKRSAVGKVKKVSARLLKRLDWLKMLRRGGSLAFSVVTGIPSPDMITSAIAGIDAITAGVKTMSAEDIEAKLTEAGSFLKAAEEYSVPEEIHKFREEFVELLSEAKIEQLVVLIDDLDRCLPATAIDTLEAIRLFLFVPKTAFVIGADEGMIEYAVRQHFPNLPLVSGPIPYARHYLEKLVQVPFRIPALGIPESRTYVTLLIVEALVGEDHAGFKKLLDKARDALNQPWLATGVTEADVRAVDPARKDDLDGALLLAQQIGPILAEGTRGNPRQIKRFLNSLFIRAAIAKARRFTVNEAILAKLMLAERFQPDYYEHLASAAMLATDGRPAELQALEAAATRSAAPAGTKEEKSAGLDATAQKWLDKEWLQRWLALRPSLAATDLRPYIFVARDKRVLASPAEPTGMETLVEMLGGSEMAARSVEPQVKTLTTEAAAQVFGGLRERVVRHGSFTAQPPGFEGLMLIAKHHPLHQAELLALLGSIPPAQLGFWVVKGWNEIITDSAGKDQLRNLLTQWATQNENGPLKNLAGQALAPPAKGTR
jgi:predicted KAP-like P-loop ATPase